MIRWLFPPNLPVITCVEVAFQDGSRVFMPLREYVTNPEPGSYIVRNSRNPAELPPFMFNSALYSG